jgi:hypothetical protein
MTTIDQLSALDKFKSVGKDRYVACCPAHDDKSPSLSLTDVGGKVLFYCFAGCSQAEVIDALRARGLWHKPASAWFGTDRSDAGWIFRIMKPRPWSPFFTHYLFTHRATTGA